MRSLLLTCLAASSAAYLPSCRRHAPPAPLAAAAPAKCGPRNPLKGTRSRIVANLFENLFKEDEATKARKDAQLAEQQAILARRRDPQAQAESLQRTEAARQKASEEAVDKIAWQRDESADPLGEWKRRQQAGEVNPLGYEDEPKGGIPMPMASFGVGGEFGTGGKYDNGERFDLRLPYVDQGWVEGAEEEGEAKAVPFWENLLSGGRLQREAEDAVKAAREAKP